MRNALIIGGIVIILGGAGLVGQLGGGDVGQVDGGGTAEPVAVVDDVRPVVLPGVCPVSTTTEAAKCVAVVQLDGRCLCLTSQEAGTVDGELTDASTLPAATRVRLVACPGKDKAPVSVRWEKDAGDPVPGCVVAARPMVDVTMGDAETDLVTQLRAACAPCPVAGMSWGRCPACLAEPGGCAEACR